MIWPFIISCQWVCLLAGAITWSRSRPSPSEPNEPMAPIQPSGWTAARDDSGFTPSEIDALFRQADALEMYSRKPDCFRRAVGLVRVQCSELDMDESARVKAAIQMTLCELATARHHSPPLECTMFSGELESAHLNPQSSSQGNCVEALSRSAQFWSSYSGYLREVPQLCYAFRRWNDIDTARDIYRNATLEKLALIQLISRRENAALESLGFLHAHLEEMRVVLEHMRESGRSISLTSEAVATRFAVGFDHTIELVRETISVVQKDAQDKFLTVLAQADAALNQVVEQHTVTLSAFLPTFSSALASSLDDFSSLVLQHHQNTLSLASEVDRNWRSLGSSFVNMHQSISHLVHVTNLATNALSDHANNAIVVQALQNNTNRAAVELADVITNLRDVAHTELEWINKTGGEIRERVMQWESSSLNLGWGPWWRVIAWFTRLAWHGDLSTMDVLSPFASFRIMFFILRRSFQAIISSWMSCIVILVISSRKRLSQLLFPAAPAKFSSESSPSVLPQPRVPNRMTFPNSTVYTSNDRYPRTRRISRIPDRLCNSA